ncbi:hypothetical protein IU471_21810 [Nocardia elegans]|nr:hypothetical protein [Nocardia elegans]
MRLDRYPFELFGLMYLCATNGTVIVLRAIPEGTDPAVATSILAAAGRTARNDAARQ